MAELTKAQSDVITEIADERIKEKAKKALIDEANVKRAALLEQIRAIDEKLLSDIERI
jgi:hypothetical protein